jgi:hypothetical protein
MSVANHMLSMTGQLLNLYENPVRTKRDTGEQYGGESRIELLCRVTLENGAVKHEMQSLRCEHPKRFEKLVGQHLTLPVSFYITKGTVIFKLLDEEAPTPTKAA